jgi:uncharacterized surface protein with fasciclin (FAS1) repeats
MTRTRKPGMAAVGLLAAMSLALSACGGSEASTDAGSNADGNGKGKAEASADAGGDTMAAQFGDGCAAVPADGEGSFDGMADDPVATAASNNPALSTLVQAVTKAQLVDTLNGAEAVTVFAPTNDAFEAMDQATLKKAMGDPKGLLTTVLTHHVVEGELAPGDLAGTHETLAGDEVTVEGSGEDFTVDGSAQVVCGNVQTANATVYIVDGVLTPKG